jgi:hypothetical protein
MQPSQLKKKLKKKKAVGGGDGTAKRTKLSPPASGGDRPAKKQSKPPPSVAAAKPAASAASAQPAPAAAAGATSVIIGSARRKLLDSCMSTFLIGNTHARSLLPAAAAAAIMRQGAAPAPPVTRLLFIGVGDVRNPLTTLLSLTPPPGGGPLFPVELFLNDLSPVTLARGVVLLALACPPAGAGAEANARAAAAATAVWSDALLEPWVAQALAETLSALAAGRAPAWLAVDERSLSRLLPIWRAWLRFGLGAERVLRVRDAVLAVPGAGHGRAGCSVQWRRFGVSSADCLAGQRLAAEGGGEGAAAELAGVLRSRPAPNPTLLDCLPRQAAAGGGGGGGEDEDEDEEDEEGAPSPVFLETQGPMGAFAATAGLQASAPKAR